MTDVELARHQAPRMLAALTVNPLLVVLPYEMSCETALP